jgi:MFS transporter, ACDE family, multidrug resistance protein
MLAAADAGLDEDGHPSSEHGELDDVAGEVADEFGGAGAAIDSELRTELRRGERRSEATRS